MGEYSAGDLSKLFQGSGANVSQPASGLFSPKRPSQSVQSTENVKKIKKKNKKGSPEKVKNPQNTIIQNVKPDVTTDKKKKHKSKKKKLKNTTEATQDKLEVKQDDKPAETVGDKKKKKKSKKKKLNNSTEVSQDKINVKQNNASEETLDENENKKSKKKKKKKKKTATDTAEAKKTPGFSPPPGIVHESLAADKQDTPGTQKTKKRKAGDVDSDGEEVDSKKSKLATEKTRMRRDRLKKKDEKRTVFIGNLPISVKKKELMKMFKVFGEIESIRYRCLPTNDPAVPKRVIAIKEEFHPSRNNCVAYVCYNNEESAQKALSLNGKEIEGLHIRVDIAGKVDKSDMKTSVFVGNLAYDASNDIHMTGLDKNRMRYFKQKNSHLEEEQLREHFEDCGEIENVRIIRDRKTSIGKGFGYVKFAEKDSVSFATKLSGSVLKKRQIRVMACVSKLKKSAKDEKDKKKKKPKKKVKKSPDGEDLLDEKMFEGSKKFQEAKKTDNFKSPTKPFINFKPPSQSTDSFKPSAQQNGKTSHIHFGDDDASVEKKSKNKNFQGAKFRINSKKDKKPKKTVRPSNVKKTPFHNKLAKKDSKKPKKKTKRF